MPKIRPFKGIRPNKDSVKEVIIRPFEKFGSEAAGEILKSNPKSFLNVIEPSLGNGGYLRGSKEEIMHHIARENFESLLKNKTLIQDSSACLYIYKEEKNGKSQTGIWACSSIDDYLNNTIRKHEHTRADREKGLIAYLENTRVDANPVLITYPGNSIISQIIESTEKKDPVYNFNSDTDTNHKLWLVDEPSQIDVIVKEFANMPCVYLADGHHRAAAASLLGMQKRIIDLRYNGNEDYNFFTSLYFSFDQIKIYEFHRLISDLNNLSEDEFLDKISEHFIIIKNKGIEKPEKIHHFGMYLNNQWYTLIAKNTTYSNNDPVDKLDVTILHKYLLDPILGIKDARTDNRISFQGGVKDINELVEKVNTNAAKVAFALFPTSIEELIEVADNGEVMPPKSTWFEPKLHCGLITHQI